MQVCKGVQDGTRLAVNISGISFILQLLSSGSGWSPVGVVSGGEYGVPEGLVFSLPSRCVEGAWQVEAGLALSEDIQVSAYLYMYMYDVMRSEVN